MQQIVMDIPTNLKTFASLLLCEQYQKLLPKAAKWGPMGPLGSIQLKFGHFSCKNQQQHD
jgi:hypothetical protein